ncbi:MAG: helix-turn-helix domain-containing protein [Candidatus Limnocylindria bacterium]
MAVATFTRRQVVDMLPEYLTKRSAGFGPAREVLMKEAGVSADVVTTLSTGLIFVEGDKVRREMYEWRSPYATKRPSVLDGWSKVVEAGLADATPDGWRPRPQGIALAERAQRALREHLRGLPLPADAVRRTADALEPIADRVPSDARRAALARKLRPKDDEPGADALRLNRSATELWYFRDDCHIGAWQAAGYRGPIFDVLSHLWSSPPDMSWTKLPGATSLDQLAKALEQRQGRADVERAVQALVDSGDVAREGDALKLTPRGKVSRDAIEDETDRRFFAIWSLDQAATAKLGEDLRAVIDALA